MHTVVDNDTRKSKVHCSGEENRCDSETDNVTTQWISNRYCHSEEVRLTSRMVQNQKHGSAFGDGHSNLHIPE